MRILIAEADQSLAAAYALAFVDRGWESAVALNAMDCVSKLRNFEPDLIVLDVKIPWGNGVGVLARMYGEEDLPKVPVIALVESMDSLETREVCEFPVADLVLKPCSPLQLAEDLQAVRFASNSIA